MLRSVKNLVKKVLGRGPAAVRQVSAAYRIIEQSGLFDKEYYLATYPDIRTAGIDPLGHYLEHGHGEGRNPSPLFATSWYRQAYPEVSHAGVNPLLHFITRGWREGKNPCPLFETAYYLQSSPELLTENLNPLSHYLRQGAWAGKNPNPVFDSAYYLAHNVDVRDSGENPLVHYARSGFFEGRLMRSWPQEFSYRPKISIITPVYNVAEPYLRACIESVRAQSYDKWQLCLADDASTEPHIKKVLLEYQGCDPRITVCFLDKNQGISGATNAAAALASGDYLGFLDNDDELTHDALLEVVRSLNAQAADILYSDECFIDTSGQYRDAHYKPDFSPDLLLSHNYITHFTVMRTLLFTQLGGMSAACSGAQDYDLMLRATELTASITHIPRILYRWRMVESSTSSDPEAKSYADDAGKLALEAALQRRRIAATVETTGRRFYYRVHRALTHRPLVSIIIPFCDQAQYLRQCLAAILDHCTYPHFEIIGVNNNSCQAETFQAMAELRQRDPRISFLDYNQPFNYSKINNFAVQHATGEHIVFMNNDIEVITPDWLESLLEHSQRPEVGAVGAKLYYGNETIQHAGVIIGIAGFAGHSHRHFARTECGYFNRLNCTQNVSAVTAALLMVKKSVFLEVGGLDADNLQVALNDVDFCLKLREHGYLNVFTPYCEAYHFESISRGYEDTPEKKARFTKEFAFFQQKWARVLAAGDPYYNPNLTLEREDFSRTNYPKWYATEEERQRYLTEAGA